MCNDAMKMDIVVRRLSKQTSEHSKLEKLVKLRFYFAEKNMNALMHKSNYYTIPQLLASGCFVPEERDVRRDALRTER